MFLGLFGRFLFLGGFGRLFLGFLAGFLGFAHDLAPYDCQRTQAKAQFNTISVEKPAIAKDALMKQPIRQEQALTAFVKSSQTQNTSELAISTHHFPDFLRIHPPKEENLSSHPPSQQMQIRKACSYAHFGLVPRQPF